MEPGLNNKINITALKRIPTEKGDILHALKCSENDYKDFGEAYFSCVNKGSIKGWKKHSLMQLNLIVPLGNIKFYLFDEDFNSAHTIILGSNNYCRLMVKPGVWVAFEGVDENNILLNIASIEHNPDEAINKPVEYFMKYFDK
jgi:dTDP-4-dehydrorhamnose 3,5-epimerase